MNTCVFDYSYIFIYLVLCECMYKLMFTCIFVVVCIMLCLCVHLCVYVCVHACVFVHLRTLECLYIYIYVGEKLICVSVRVFARKKFLNLHVRACHLILYTCEWVRVCVCMRACVCLYVYERACALMHANVCVWVHIQACSYIYKRVCVFFMCTNEQWAWVAVYTYACSKRMCAGE